MSSLPSFAPPRDIPASPPLPRLRRGLAALFAIYLALLVWIVVFKLEVPFAGGPEIRSVKLVPFVASGDDGPSAPLEVVANVLLFIPFGVYVGMLAGSWTWRRAIGVFAAVSLVFEVAQFVFATGSSDVTDIVTNTAGGLIGLAALAGARRTLTTRALVAMTRVCAIGTVLAMLAVTAYVLSPLRYTSPPGSAAPGAESGHSGRLADTVSEDDGILPGWVTAFDDGYPGVANLDPALLAAVREATSDAEDTGIRLLLTSGWRSAAYQGELLRESVAEYGSEEEAARWVATPETSAHVSGDAVDVGPAEAAAWLSEHGAAYGLCQIYGNEPWHFELRPDAVSDGCPRMYPDPTYDPAMQG